MKKTLLFLLCGAMLFSCSRKTTSQGSSSKIEGLNADWKYSYSSEKNAPKVAYRDLPTLAFLQSENKITGSGGCNELNGSYTISSNQLTFNNIVLTRKKCNNMAIEKFVVDFLKTVGYYKLESNKLFLYSKNNRSKFIVYAKRLH